MRIAVSIFEQPGQIASPNIWLLRMIPHWQSTGHSVLVIAHCRRDRAMPTVDRLRRDGVTVGIVDWRGRPWGEQLAGLMWGMLRRFAADVFLAQLSPLDLLVARGCRTVGVATAVVFHRPDELVSASAQLMTEAPANWLPDLTVCVSRQLVGRAEEAFGGHAVHLPVGAPVQAHQAQWRENEFRLIYLGWFENGQKRVEETARAMCRAAAEIPGVQGVMFGSGAARAAVERILAQQGNGRVHYGGIIAPEEVCTHLRAAHALLLLSDFEGTPTVVMEAMACGVVPIVTPLGGVAEEMVEPNVTGIIVRDRDDDFVRAVRGLASDKNRWRAMSSAARQAAAERWDSATIAARWIDLFARALQPGRRGLWPRRLPSELALPRKYAKRWKSPPIVLTAAWLVSSRTLAWVKQWLSVGRRTPQPT